MPEASHYIIRGGDSGAARLRILTRAFFPGTLSLLDRAGVLPGMSVLDLGCGSGEVTRELARRVGPRGRVIGLDMDERVLDHARLASPDVDLPVEWRLGRVEELAETGAYDVIYGRFVLSHLADPADALRRMRAAARPGGLIVVEDIDITAHAHWPPSGAFRRYIELYAATARARGANSSIGPSLAALLVEAGLEEVSVAINMPVFREGQEKGIARITLENIAEAAIASRLTTAAEIEQLLRDLAGHEADPRSIQSAAQLFQCTGRCPRSAQKVGSE